MTEPIATALESITGILTAESWPTGTANDGPIEYSISYDPDLISAETVLTHLERLTIETLGTGFVIESRLPAVEADCPLTASVHFHPFVGAVKQTLEASDVVSGYGFEWNPPDIWACYDNSPYLALVTPGPLNGWFTATDFDTVLDALETAVAEANVAGLESSGTRTNYSHFTIHPL